jgi:hypothetical protein
MLIAVQLVIGLGLSASSQQWILRSLKHCGRPRSTLQPSVAIVA